MKQSQRIIEHLNKYGKITSLEAIDLYGITRLSAVIWRLRHEDGYIITSTLKSGLNRFSERVHYTEYSLLKSE